MINKEENRFMLLMILAMFLWGAGWPALKMITTQVSFEVLTFWRFFLMIFAMIPIVIYIKKPLHVNKTSLKYIGINALLNVAFMIFAFLGVKEGSASAGGVMITTLSPLFTFLLITTLFKKSLTSSQIMGLFIGLVGGFIMTNVYENGFLYLFEAGNIYFILAALTWAVVTLVAQSSHSHIDPIHFSFYIAIVATFIMGLIAIDSDIWVVFNQGSEFWLPLLYLSVFGQSIATTIFYVATSKLGSSKASSFMFLVPLFALISSSLILGEAIYLHILFGGFLSLVAVYLINFKRAK